MIKAPNSGLTLSSSIRRYFPAASTLLSAIEVYGIQLKLRLNEPKRRTFLLLMPWQMSDDVSCAYEEVKVVGDSRSTALRLRIDATVMFEARTRCLQQLSTLISQRFGRMDTTYLIRPEALTSGGRLLTSAPTSRAFVIDIDSAVH